MERPEPSLEILTPLGEHFSLLLADSRDVLQEWFKSIRIDGVTVSEWNEAHPAASPFDVSLTLPCCPEVVVLRGVEDIPEHSLRCSHGNYWIKYRTMARNDLRALAEKVIGTLLSAKPIIYGQEEKAELFSRDELS